MQKGFISIIAILIVLIIIAFIFISGFSFSGSNQNNSGIIQPVDILAPQIQISDTLKKIDDSSKNYGKLQEDAFNKINELFPKDTQ